MWKTICPYCRSVNRDPLVVKIVCSNERCITPRIITCLIFYSLVFWLQCVLSNFTLHYFIYNPKVSKFIKLCRIRNFWSNIHSLTCRLVFLFSKI